VRLETERLVLREMNADDVEPLLGVFGDERVMASFASAPFDRVAMERWVARNLAHQRDHGYGLFTLIDKADGTVIGDCGLEHMDIGAELGYDLRADRWGRGLATEAAIAVRDFAFATLRLPRLVSLVRVGNQRSRRVAEKVGMTLREDLVRGEIRYWVMELSGPGG
jgi:RimJ/RimL family protein N-acetyltransferase